MGQYLEQHALDPRNSDPVQTRIQLDTDSREYVEYLKELFLMCNQVRSDNGLGIIQMRSFNTVDFLPDPVTEKICSSCKEPIILIIKEDENGKYPACGFCGDVIENPWDGWNQ